MSNMTMQGKLSTGKVKEIGVTGDAAHVQVQGGTLTGYSELAAITNASIGNTVPNGSANGIRLDSTIGAAASSTLRVYSPVDCYIGWGATEAAAESAAVIPVDATAGDGIIFVAGTEQLTVPASLTGQVWIAMWGVSATGLASIALMT